MNFPFIRNNIPVAPIYEEYLYVMWTFFSFISPSDIVCIKELTMQLKTDSQCAVKYIMTLVT